MCSPFHLSLPFLFIHSTASSQEEEDEGSSTASDSDVLTQESYEQAEKLPILSVRKSWDSGQAPCSLCSRGFRFFVEGALGSLPANTSAIPCLCIGS